MDPLEPDREVRDEAHDSAPPAGETPPKDVSEPPPRPRPNRSGPSQRKSARRKSARRSPARASSPGASAEAGTTAANDKGSAPAREGRAHTAAAPSTPNPPSGPPPPTEPSVPTEPSGKLRWREAPSIPGTIRATFEEGLAYAHRMVERAPEHPRLSVHEYRKTIRRLRALVKLLREVIGEPARRSIDTGLRSAVLPTSGLRDAHILLAALEAIPREPGEKKLRKALRNHWDHRLEQLAEGDEEVRVLAASRAPLTRLPGELADALPAVLPPEQLSDALRESFERARKAFRTAVRVLEDEAIHRARKRVKEVRYQLEWLATISAPRIGKRHERFARLAQDLGDVTDGIVLEAAVLDMGPDLKGLGANRFRRRISRRTMVRFEEVVAEYESLFEEPSRRFVRGVASGL